MQKYIDSAVEQFRTLITEQLARQNEMEKGAKAKDFATADAIRDKLKEMGIILEDTPQGVKWTRS